MIVRALVQRKTAGAKLDRAAVTWSDLSDVKLAQALDDRGSFRRFRGFFGLRADTGAHGLCALSKSSCGKWSGQEPIRRDHRPTKAIQAKTGTLVDATIIASAREDDNPGRWVKHKGRRAAHRFKAHVGADADMALVEEIAITSANINDGKAGPDALPDNPGDVFADSAYRGSYFGDAVRAKGGTPRIVATGMWGRDEAETQARHDAFNQPIHRIRGRIEKIFGTCKRSYGLCRMRWRGLARPAFKFASPPSPTI